ncbi:MAG TPA: hypothetical protein VGN33_05095 [Leifsonia sp.]|nr:hypothetical protein [Leifsonia sp.]
MTSRYAAIFFLAGSACIVAGGLVAAATTPLDLVYGSWSAAYLVLVCGVAQCLFGVVRSELAPAPLTRAGFATEFSFWNLGNAAVIAGTLVNAPLVVDSGGALLVVVLLMQISHLRYAKPGLSWALWLYGIVIAILLLSIPIGLVLAVITTK